MRYLILVSALILPVSAFAVDVKGLKLGNVTTFQEIANIFGNASCPKDELKSLNFMGEFECTVPTSYLGVKTTAKISLDRNWGVQSIQIEMPTNLLPQVETFVTKNYGKPDVVRGKVEVLQLTEAGGTQSHPRAVSDQCSRWNNLDSVKITVCEYRNAISGPSSITYRYTAPKVLDETDL